MGLVNPNYGFGGLDGAIHLAEDCVNATKIVPLATIFSIVTAVVTTFFFAVAMLYCINDIGSVISTRTGQVSEVNKAIRHTNFEQDTSIRDHCPSYKIESNHDCLHGPDDKRCSSHSHRKYLSGFENNMVICERRSTCIL